MTVEHMVCHGSWLMGCVLFLVPWARQALINACWAGSICISRRVILPSGGPEVVTLASKNNQLIRTKYLYFKISLAIHAFQTLNTFCVQLNIWKYFSEFIFLKISYHWLHTYGKTVIIILSSNYKHPGSIYFQPSVWLSGVYDSQNRLSCLNDGILVSGVLYHR